MSIIVTDGQPLPLLETIARRSADGAALRRMLFAIAVLAVWSILGRYWGIQHDALGYVLQAVARLHPDPLAGDIFLRYRSQDEFTLFPQFAALAVEWWGVDRSAALLTFLFLVLWLIAASVLLRQLQGSGLTWLSIGLLLVIPGWYSAGEVFRYAEPFFTARALAEALSLGAIAAGLGSRWVLAAILAILAMSVHPLMGFPAALLLVLLKLPLVNWQRWFGITGLVVTAAIVGSFILGRPDPLMHGDWLEITRWRSGFLFLGSWTISDREVAAQTLLTLVLAGMVLPACRARAVVRAALALGLTGLLLALVASEFLPLKILMQGQAWRWLWLGRFFAIALLPLTLLALWSNARTGRASAVLLACAWLLTDAGSFRDVPPIGMGGLLCGLAVCIWLARDRVSTRIGELVAGLSWLVAGVVAITFASITLVAARNDFSFGRDPLWVQRITDMLYTPGIAATIVVFAWYSAFVARRHGAAIATALAGVILLLAAAPETARVWLRTPFDDEQRAKFADWRHQIRPDAEVLWHEAPQATWFLLNRRSYLTVSQAAGTVFSPETTIEIARRAKSLSALVAPGVWYLNPETRLERFHDLTPAILGSICRDRALGFVVSRIDLGSSAASAEWPGKGDFVYLYDCNTFRSGTEQ